MNAETRNEERLDRIIELLTEQNNKLDKIIELVDEGVEGLSILDESVRKRWKIPHPAFENPAERECTAEPSDGACHIDPTLGPCQLDESTGRCGYDPGSAHIRGETLAVVQDGMLVEPAYQNVVEVQGDHVVVIDYDPATEGVPPPAPPDAPWSEDDAG